MSKAEAAPVTVKVYKVNSFYWGMFVAVDHYDDAIEFVRDFLEAALDNGGNDVVTVTIEQMSEDEYKAIPEFEGW